MKRTKLSDRTLPVYTRGEEIANMVTHIVGGAFGILVLAACLLKARRGDGWDVVGAWVYGLSMIALYTVSSVYHGLTAPMGKKVMQVVDHCTIYLLIGGTYTPILFSAIRPVFPGWAWTIFGLVWGIAAVATVFTAIDLKKYATLSMACRLVYRDGAEADIGCGASCRSALAACRRDRLYRWCGDLRTGEKTQVYTHVVSYLRPSGKCSAVCCGVRLVPVMDDEQSHAAWQHGSVLSVHFPVSCNSHAGVTAEQPPQVDDVKNAYCIGKLLLRKLQLSQQSAGQPDPLPVDVGNKRQSLQPDKLPVQIVVADAHEPCNGFYRDLFVKVFADVVLCKVTVNGGFTGGFRRVMSGLGQCICGEICNDLGEAGADADVSCGIVALSQRKIPPHQFTDKSAGVGVGDLSRQKGVGVVGRLPLGSVPLGNVLGRLPGGKAKHKNTAGWCIGNQMGFLIQVQKKHTAFGIGAVAVLLLHGDTSALYMVQRKPVSFSFGMQNFVLLENLTANPADPGTGIEFHQKVIGGIHGAASKLFAKIIAGTVPFLQALHFIPI